MPQTFPRRADSSYVLHQRRVFPASVEQAARPAMPAVPPAGLPAWRAGLRAPRVWLRLCCSKGRTPHQKVCGITRGRMRYVKPRASGSTPRMRTRRLTIRRALWLGLVILVAAGLVAPYLNADRFGDRIRRAMEQALDRKVEIAAVRFNLFRGPGFTLQGVVIHDDPAVGVEPFAYVTSIEARIRFTSLWRGRLEFSSLRLEQPSVNLVKSASGVWNFQPLLN